MIKNNLIVKANKLNESRYRLSVQEQRVILTMISMIKPGDVAFKPYSFTVKDFADLIGITGKNIYGRVKDVTKSLIGRNLTISEDNGDLHIGWISSAKYYDGEGLVELRFDPLLKPYLLALKQEFTRYQLKNTIRLKSVYSVRIYELLKQYQSIGSRYFDLEDLRDRLGIPDKKLRPYANFRIRVIERAKVELNNTDIGFNYTPVKAGRRVAGLNFDIIKNDGVVKKSHKKKSERKIKEDQLKFDLTRDKYADSFVELDRLSIDRPELYQKLEKQAKKRISKKDLKKPGQKTTIRFKMADLLPGFLQKNKGKL